MRKIDESRAANYIRKHSNYKKWLAFVLCLSLLTGTITLYILNKPATAMTEEGAKSVGLILETADAEEEAELIQQTIENKEAAENQVTTDDSSEVVETVENSVDVNVETEDISEAEAETSEVAEDTTSEDAGLEAEEKAEPTKEKELSTEEKLAMLDVPDSVDVADYVTETIIERKLEDGSWERIEKENLKEGDYIKVTFKYSIPDKAKLSDDIHLEIPEEFEKLNTETASLSSDGGIAELTAENQIKIEYDDEVKKSIIDDVDIDREDTDESNEGDDGLHAAVDKIDSFFKSLSLKVYAADETDGESVSVQGRYGNRSSSTGDTSSNMVVDSSSVYKTAYTWVNGEQVLKEIKDLEKVQDGDTIAANQELLFELKFHIEPNTLNSKNNTFQYDLKKAGFTSVTPETDRTLSAFDENNNKIVIGKYSINSDGIVTFYPNEEWVKKNEDGERLGGAFDFITKADSSQSDEEGKIEYTFNDKVKIYVFINNKNSHSASVSKSETAYDDSTGKISYKIIISTGDAGTGGTIDFTDELSVLGSDKTTTDSQLTALIDASETTDINVTFVDANNNWARTDYTSGLQINTNGQLISINDMPGLEKGQSYEITYSYVVPEEIRGKLLSYLKNEAKIEVENIETTPSIVTHEFRNIPKIDKEASDNNGVIKWTITLNSNHANLKGYVLTDYLKSIGQDSQEVHSFNVTSVSYEAYDTDDNKVKSGNLDFTNNNGSELYYKFEQDDTYKYIITYTTKENPLDKDWNNRIVNHAEIKLDVDENIKNSAEAYINVDGDVMEKKAEELIEKGETANIKWLITFHPNIIRNEVDEHGQSFWRYKDTINTTGVEQYITEAQKAAILDSLSQLFGSQMYTCEFSGNAGKYTGFEIKVYKDIVEKDYSFEYETTGVIGDGNSYVNFKNDGYVFTGRFGSSDNITYYPLLTKMDGSGNSFGKTEQSEHEYYSSALLEKGIMQWIICVSVPAGYKDYLQIVEKLPANSSIIDEAVEYGGKTYYGLEIASDIGISKDNKELVDGSSFMDTTFNVSKDTDGRLITIDFDGQKMAGKTFFFRICASIDDEFWQDGKITMGEFPNEVTLKKKDGEDLSTKEQTQIITKTESVIEKTGERYVVDTEAVDSYKYLLDINENGADLLEEGDTLTLIDTLHTYSRLDGDADVDFSVNLDTNNLKVYVINEDGSRSELDKSMYSYMLDDYYTDEYTYGSSNYKVNHYSVLEMNIPDEMHLQVEYVYRFYGTKGTTIYLDNEAYLKGVANGNTAHHYEDRFIIQDDSAYMWTEAVRVVKVDDTNTEVVLPGAKFKLYKYTLNSNVGDESSAKGTYEPVSDKVYDAVTNADGTIIFNSVIAYNTAYKLVEVEAPEGYISTDKDTYFLYDSNTEKLQDIKPDDFEKCGGKRYSFGAPIYIRNTPNKTSIVVNKIWDEAGADSSYRPEVINVILNRSLVPVDTEKEVVESYNTVNILRKNPNGVIQQFIGLPSVKSGSTIEFTVGGTKVENGWKELPTVEINGVAINVDAFFGYSESKQTATITYKVEGNTDIVITDGWNNPVETTYSIIEPSVINVGSDATVPYVEDNAFPKKIQLEGSKDSATWTRTVDNLDKYYVAEDGKLYKWLYYIESEEANAFYSYEADKARINSGTLTITNHRNSVEGYELPRTGGSGTMPYALLGLGITGSAVIGKEIVRRRKKDEDPV